MFSSLLKNVNSSSKSSAASKAPGVKKAQAVPSLNLGQCEFK